MIYICAYDQNTMSYTFMWKWTSLNNYFKCQKMVSNQTCYSKKNNHVYSILLAFPACNCATQFILHMSLNSMKLRNYCAKQNSAKINFF